MRKYKTVLDLDSTLWVPDSWYWNLDQDSLSLALGFWIPMVSEMPDSAIVVNTPTNLCMALLNVSLFRFVLYCYAFVQYCNVQTIQYNTTHKFVGVLNNPRFRKRELPGFRNPDSLKRGD